MDDRERTYALGALVVFAGLQAIAIARHPIWIDEAQAWGIARASGSLRELWDNGRYEGHPPLWSLLLFVLTRLTTTVEWMQVVTWALSVMTGALLLLRSPFRIWTSAPMTFGYYVMFEYGQISRNYVLALFLVVLALTAVGKTAINWPLFVGALSLASLTMVLAIPLAVGLFAGAVVHRHGLDPRRWNKRVAVGALVLVAAIALAVFYAAPPGDSTVPIAAESTPSLKARLYTALSHPLGAAFPWPERHPVWGRLWTLLWPVKIKIALSCLAVAGLLWVLRRCPSAMVAFCCALAGHLLLIVAAFSTSQPRHVGFVALAGLGAVWLAARDGQLPTGRLVRGAAVAVLSVHAFTGLAFTAHFLRNDFDRSRDDARAVEQAAPDALLLGDGDRVAAVAAYLDKEYYQAGGDTPVRHFVWKEGAAGSRRSVTTTDIANQAVRLAAATGRPVVILNAADGRELPCTTGAEVSTLFEHVTQIACAAFLVEKPIVR